MPGSTDQIISLNISLQSSPLSQASFSIPLIVGPTEPSSGIINAFSSPAGMLSDGYDTDSPEYVYALEMFEQQITPALFMVGMRTDAEAQVDTFEVATVSVGHTYSFKLNGTSISYTALSGDSYGQILTGLNSAITSAFPTDPPVSGAVSGSGGSSLLTLTSEVAGQGVTYTTIDPLLTHVAVTPNNGIANDLAAMIAVSNGWYGLCGCEFTDNDILQAAAAIEPLKKIYLPVSSTAAIATSSTTDIGSVLKARSYNRTGLIFTADTAEGKDAAWLGGQLPTTPGSSNWAYKTLVGCTPDTLSDNQQLILIGVPVTGVKGKNVNIYQTVGGANITQMGTMASGQFIDVTVGVDWLDATITTNVFQALVSAAKIPYTDAGTSILISAVDQAIKQGIANGLIDGSTPYTITAPLVSTVSPTQRANRIAPTISFTCRLAGAYNAVVINGTVTV